MKMACGPRSALNWNRFQPLFTRAGNKETKSIEADNRRVLYHPTLLAMFPLASATEDPYRDTLFLYKGLAQTIENVTR